MLLLCLSCGAQRMKFPTQEQQKEEAEVRQTVRSFLLWYAENASAIKSVTLVPASRDGDPNNTYSVSMDSLDLFISKLKSSGYLSDHYLTMMKEYVGDCDRLMKNQTDGPPQGLDFDLVLRTNDSKTAISKIKSGFDFSSYRQRNGISTINALLIFPLSFELIKDGDRWFIIRIDLSR